MINKLKVFLARIYEIPGGQSRYRSMEGLRAYAALLVFFVHYFDAYLREYLKIPPESLTFPQTGSLETGVLYYLWASHYGVDIFFFLSGFLICGMVIRPTLDLKRFLIFRLARIYPAALIAVVFWAYMRIVYQNWYEFIPLDFIGNLLFLNAIPALGIRAYAEVTWSLFYELFFYITFPIVILAARRMVKIRPVSLIVIGIAYTVLVQPLGFMATRFLMFFGGALLALLSKETVIRIAAIVPDGLAAAAFLTSTLLFTVTLSYFPFVPVFVVTVFFFVLKILFGNGILSRVFALTPLRWMGNISYSFYLLHGLGIHLILYQFFSCFSGLGKVTFVAVTLSLSLVIGILVSTLLYIVAERPYYLLKSYKSSSALGKALRAT